MANHKEILRLKSLGLTNRGIADASGCGSNTVTCALARAREQLIWQQPGETMQGDASLQQIRLHRGLSGGLDHKAVSMRTGILAA